MGTVSQVIGTICTLSSRPNLASSLAPAASLTRLAELLQMDLHLTDPSCDSNTLVVSFFLPRGTTADNVPRCESCLQFDSLPLVYLTDANCGKR